MNPRFFEFYNFYHKTNDLVLYKFKSKHAKGYADSFY